MSFVLWHYICIIRMVQTDLPIKPNSEQSEDGKPRVPLGQPGRRSILQTGRNFAQPVAHINHGFSIFSRSRQKRQRGRKNENLIDRNDGGNFRLRNGFSFLYLSFWEDRHPKSVNPSNPRLSRDEWSEQVPITQNKRTSCPDYPSVPENFLPEQLLRFQECSHGVISAGSDRHIAQRSEW